MNWCARWGIGVVLAACFATEVLAQGIGYGTSVVLLRSPSVLLAAVDSRENYLLYRDGVSTVERKTTCKVARIGPWYAIVAGIANGTNGFDALRASAESWRAGDTIDELASRIGAGVPRLLVPLLKELRTADPAGFVRRYGGQAAVQLALIGAEKGVPEIRIIEFVDEENGPEKPALAVRTAGCPGSCANPRTAWFLGTHDRIDEFIRGHLNLIDHPDEKGVERLIDLEYADRPDLVGGPLSIVRVDRTGGAMVRGGACSAN